MIGMYKNWEIPEGIIQRNENVDWDLKRLKNVWKCGEIPEDMPVNIDMETMDKWFGRPQARC